MKGEKMKKTGLIIGAVVVIIVAIVGVKVAYDAGYREAEKAAEVRIEKLAESVEAKAKVVKILSEIRVPGELNDDTVSEYLAEIEKAEGEIEDEEIRGLLARYREKWADFKVTFMSQDNNLISRKVEELKSAAKETAEEIRGILDRRIGRD